MNLDDLLKSIREEDDDSKGAKIDPEKFLKRKTFENPLKGQQFTAPSIPGAGISKPVVKTVIVNIEPDKLIPPDKEKTEVSQELIDKLDELISVIKDDNELEEDRQNFESKAASRKKREEREKRIEKDSFSTVKNTLGVVKKNIGNVMDTVIRFLVFTLLGGLVTFISNFLKDPKNKQFIEDAQKFLFKDIPKFFEDAKEKLQPVIDWFKELIPKIRQFAEDFRLLLARFPFLGELFKTKEEKEAGLPPAEELFTTPGNVFGYEFPIYSAPSFKGGFGFSEGGMISMGTDTVPAMLTPGEFVMSRGAVNKFGVDTMMAINKAGGGTNRPKFGMVSGFSGGGFTRDVTKLLENYEGLRLNAYPDPASGGEPITIGVGATRYPPGFRFGRSKVMLGDTITKEEAYMIKDYDVKRHTQIAKDRVGHETWPKLPENVKFALISKAFNYGTVYSGALRAVDNGVKTGDYSELASYYRNVLAKHNKGINSWRRNDEAGIIESGKSKRSGMEFTTELSTTPVESKTPLIPPPSPPSAPPPVIPSTTVAGSKMGPAFGDDLTALKHFRDLNEKRQYEIRKEENFQVLVNTLRRFLPLPTPNQSSSSNIMVLPSVKQDTSNKAPVQSNKAPIPEFTVSSGIKMRTLVGKSLGIEDLVS